MKIPRFSDAMGPGSSSLKPTQVVVHHSQYTPGQTTGGLSVVFTILCIVDLFGVFPIVALPKSVIACGIYGIPLVVSVFALQLYTAVLLGRSWLLAQELSPSIKEKNRSPYAAIAELAFGAHARRLVTFLINAAIFGAGVPNFIFAAQSMQLFCWKITGGEVGVSYCLWMIILGLLLCPVMWLGSPKDMKPIALTSVGIVLTVAVSTWICIYTDDQSPPSSGDVLERVPDPRDFLIAYGIIAFQFDIHPMLLTLQVDMKDSRRICSAALGGFLATGSLFGVTALMAAQRYGNNVHSNILRGMPPSVTMYIVALLVTLQLCLSSAVGNSALFQHIEELLKIPREFGFKRCLVRSSIVILAVFLGESVPRFDVVMGLVGSTLTGPLMFIFPPLFFLKLCYTKTRQTEETMLLLREAKDIGNVHSIQETKQYGGLQQNGGFHQDGGVRQNGGQNGGLSFPIIYRNALQPEYYQSRYEIRENSEYTIKRHDLLLATLVVLLGVVATIVAAYSSWSDAISSASFTQPCIVNSTAAARSFVVSAETEL
ncbi:uncharacterized protein [Epargyreus clarus]|uniref:uncharacterized protein n=1 Tax=Epargyreus clarus TaxID=520877 RepID=UPI003C2B0908